MNLREISIEEARNLPSGTELWVGQTRRTAVAGCKEGQWLVRDGAKWFLAGDARDDFNLKLFIPTHDAVPIEPDEAAARMVRGEPVESYGSVSDDNAKKLKAALENTQGEDREADRPDLEKALEESVSSSYWLRAPLTYADLVEMNLTDKHPNLAKWLKSRGAE